MHERLRFCLSFLGTTFVGRFLEAKEKFLNETAQNAVVDDRVAALLSDGRTLAEIVEAGCAALETK